MGTDLIGKIQRDFQPWLFSYSMGTDLIGKIQRDFLAAGYQWKEHIFNDGKAECSLEFTQDKSPHALSNYPRPADCVGWGRFDRLWAWVQAHNWLVAKQAA